MRVRAMQNPAFGLQLAPTTAFSEVFATGSTGTDVIGGVQIGPSHCEDGSCWAQPPRRRFYLTPTVAADATQAPTSCADGFHFASLWEILNPGALAYDTSLGHSLADAGRSAPVGASGSVRTGMPSLGATSPATGSGSANCSAWTSASPAQSGSTARLVSDWLRAPPGIRPLAIAPWSGGIDACSFPHHVWCIED